MHEMRIGRTEGLENIVCNVAWIDFNKKFAPLSVLFKRVSHLLRQLRLELSSGTGGWKA